LITSIEQLKDERMIGPIARATFVDDDPSHKYFFVVQAMAASNTEPFIEQEVTIRQQLKHPLIMSENLPTWMNNSQTIADGPFQVPTRIAGIVTGIVLAMRFIHSQKKKFMGI
jgi:hypothetical protein